MDLPSQMTGRAGQLMPVVVAVLDLGPVRSQESGGLPFAEAVKELLPLAEIDARPGPAPCCVARRDMTGVGSREISRPGPAPMHATAAVTGGSEAARRN